MNLNNLFIALVSVLIFLSGCKSPTKSKRIHKDGFVLEGNFINDSIPTGVIRFYDSAGKLYAQKKFNNGLLDGESIIYYSNGEIKSRGNFKANTEYGFKSIYDSIGHITYKSNYFYGTEIGPVFSYDDNHVTEYSFSNFEDEMLYYCSYDYKTKKYSYPSDKLLIKANTSEVTLNGLEKLSIFLYIFNPPGLKLDYKICLFNQEGKVITSTNISSINFYFQAILDKPNDSLRIGILLNKFDSLTKKEQVILQYLKSTYP